MRTPLRILIAAILAALGCWTVYFNWPQRAVWQASYAFSDEEEQRLKAYPKAQYELGMHAWLQQQPERAAGFFRQAVSQDALFLDAWLRLAEAEAALGGEEKARAILTFTTDLTEQVFRWKWPQILIARELGMQNRLYSNTNYLLSRKVLVQDALQLLHTQLGGEASAVIAVLEPANLAAYLDWLMRWGMTDESLMVWQAMNAASEPEKEIALHYAHFLLNHKRITPSVDIWQKYTGSAGLTNPGFESSLTGQGFDWRHWGEKDANWELKRVYNEAVEGEYALRIKFDGQENVSFQHLYQIFAVNPQEKYHLTYAWKSSGVTTDEGPFMEIVGYDKQGLYRAGPMINGSNGWQEETISFEVPADNWAAVVRLRRRTSMRFDSKIRGTVWLDNFRLEKATNQLKR
ncbi:MAG: hypothetical protein KFF68_11830 [Desulfosarcina sp.]|nr:hypothetical protein [Desulfosarcina sp.]